VIEWKRGILSCVGRVSFGREDNGKREVLSKCDKIFYRCKTREKRFLFGEKRGKVDQELHRVNKTEKTASSMNQSWQNGTRDSTSLGCKFAR
jgi:hypothetical protein